MVRPFAEYFACICRSSVVCMKSCIVCTGWYICEGYFYAVKTVKASVLSWGDKDGYSGAGSYWTYEYCVRAYKIVNGKRVYSKKTKTVTI